MPQAACLFRSIKLSYFEIATCFSSDSHLSFENQPERSCTIPESMNEVVETDNATPRCTTRPPPSKWTRERPLQHDWLITRRPYNFPKAYTTYINGKCMDI